LHSAKVPAGFFFFSCGCGEGGEYVKAINFPQHTEAKMRGFKPPFHIRTQDLAVNKAREKLFLSGVFAIVAHMNHVPFDLPPPRFSK